MKKTHDVLLPDEHLDAMADEFMALNLLALGITLEQFIHNPVACQKMAEKQGWIKGGKAVVFTALLLIVFLFAACAESGTESGDIASTPVQLQAPADWYEALFEVSREGENWQDFADNCFVAYQERRSQLAELWEMDETDELLEALFYLNVVGRLWAYGNYYEPDKRGCVAQNENTNHQRIDPTFADYMQSEIGCCTDHALALYEVLTGNGYAAQRISVPGHWWVEAFVGGALWTLDATMMVGWQTSLPEKSWFALKSIVFEHPGEFLGTLYRPVVAPMRARWIDGVRQKARP